MAPKILVLNLKMSMLNYSSKFENTHRNIGKKWKFSSEEQINRYIVYITLVIIGILSTKIQCANPGKR